MTDFARHQWLTSQMQWHAEQLKSEPTSKWHKSQVKFYTKAAYPHSIQALLDSTMRKRMPQIVAKLLTENALIKRIRDK